MPFVRRRPLLRMAAVGGVAYMGSKAGANRAMAQQNQAQQAQGQEPPAQAAPAPPPPPAAAASATSSASDRIAQLKELAGLRDSGALTQEEFDKEKARILA
ncbi:MAG TPA: SHOCT domain-containing protein [Acidimicrobiales bacterium]|nr:SHOCT domain-containing protein [Acidimicrobiales bacterium]